MVPSWGSCRAGQAMVSHASYGTIDDITQNLFQKHFPSEEVAAIFVEPIQGEGGYNIPPKEFLPALRELCTRHGILMVADEIQSGIGRTGKWWACQHDEVVPDMVCSAKGLASGMPLGALITKESIMVWPPGAQGRKSVQEALSARRSGGDFRGADPG